MLFTWTHLIVGCCRLFLYGKQKHSALIYINIWTAMVISCERILKSERPIWEATNFLGAMSKTFFLLDGYLNPKQPTHTHIHNWDFIEDGWKTTALRYLHLPIKKWNTEETFGGLRASFTSELIFYVDIVVRWKGSSLKLETTETFFFSESH